MKLNQQCEIQSCPNSIPGVQQSLRKRIVQRITQFIQKLRQDDMPIPTTIKIKFTGDGIRIAT